MRLRPRGIFWQAPQAFLRNFRRRRQMHNPANWRVFPALARGEGEIYSILLGHTESALFYARVRGPTFNLSSCLLPAFTLCHRFKRVRVGTIGAILLD